MTWVLVVALCGVLYGIGMGLTYWIIDEKCDFEIEGTMFSMLFWPVGLPAIGTWVLLDRLKQSREEKSFEAKKKKAEEDELLKKEGIHV